MNTENFTSYLPDFEWSAESSRNTSSSGVQVDVHSLDGEIVSVACENVIRFDPNDEGCGNKSGSGSGELGLLSCSQYRLLFTPLIPKLSACSSRSLVFNDSTDVPWKLVERIFYTTVEDCKLKPMTYGLSFNERPSTLRFELRDFRTVTFNFSTSSGLVSSKDIANYSFQFSFPSSLACYNCPKSLKQPRSGNNVATFVNQEDWTEEISRTGARLRGWKVSHFNYHCNTVPTYPKYMVVPGRLTDAQLNHTALHYNMNRLPIWCWSCVESGACIMRTAQLSVEESKEYTMFLQAVTDCHPLRIPPTEVYVDVEITAIRKAYLSLKTICLEDPFEDPEKSWNRRLNETEWVQFVALGLAASRNVVDRLINQKSVIIKESENRDISCVVSSLAQICMDPYYRTIHGFYSLMQKEWVAFGHPFGLRIFGLNKVDFQSKEMAPILLLFLDCVYQLTNMYPLHFEYTQHFLIGLWDICQSGLTEAMVINHINELDLKSDGLIDWTPPWPLSNFFNQDYCSTFVNAAYYVQTPKRSYVLPPWRIPDIQLWTDHYLRWNVQALQGPEHYMRQGGGRVLLHAGGEVSKQLTIAKMVRQTLSRYITNLECMPDPKEVLSIGYPYMSLQLIERKRHREVKPRKHEIERNMSNRGSISEYPMTRKEESVRGSLPNIASASSSVSSRNSTFLPSLKEKLNEMNMNRNNSTSSNSSRVH